MMYSFTQFGVPASLSGFGPRRSFRSQNQKRLYTMQVTGKGEVSARADQATIMIGVVTEDMKAEQAQKQNASISNQVIDALMAIGIPSENIETVSYTIDQMYDYPDGQKVFRGYQVSHQFKVLVTDLSMIGEVVDVAAQNGANQIQNIQFDVSNPDDYYREALQRAVQNAQDHAESIAGTLDVTIDPVPLWIREEAVETVRPRYTVTSTGIVAGEATPIQTGKLKTKAVVLVSFRYRGF